VLVVWADGPDTIIPTCNDFEERLIKLLWRARPGFGATPSASSHPASYADSASAHSLIPVTARGSATPSERRVPLGGTTPGGDVIKEDVEKALAKVSSEPQAVRTVKRRWYGKRVVVDENQFPNVEDAVELEYASEKRPTMLYSPLYNGIAAGLSLSESPHFSHPHLLRPLFPLRQSSLGMVSVSIELLILLEGEFYSSMKRFCWLNGVKTENLRTSCFVCSFLSYLVCHWCVLGY